MKIIFLMNRDIYTRIALNILLPGLHDDEITILYSTRVGSSKKVLPPQFEAMRQFEQDLSNFRFAARHAALNSEIPEIAEIEGLAIKNINSPDTVQQIKDLAPDLIVSIRFGQIIKNEILAIPKYGTVNLHSGLLPEYRGILATFWSLLNGATHYGYTLHTIDDSSIDTGPIIERVKRPVHHQKCLFWHICQLYPPGAESILAYINTLKNQKTLTAFPQEHAQGNYYGYPDSVALATFMQKGHQLISTLNQEKI